MDYTGEWRCSIHTPLGVQDVLLVLDSVDGALSGEARSAGETVPLIDLQLRDGRLLWTQHVTKPMRLTIAFDVARKADRLAGTAKPGLLPRVRVEGELVRGASAALEPGADAPPLHESSAGNAGGGARTRWPSLSVDTSASGGRVDVGMLVFPGMTALDLIGPHTVLSGPASVSLIGRTRDPVVSDTGVTITPDLGLDEAPADLDVLFVPGGPGQVAVMDDDATLAFLADRGTRARYVTSACTGALILGAAGLLRGYRATTHWAALDLLATFGAESVAERVVVDRNRLTGGGVTAGIDFGLVLLSELFGERVAQTTQLLMEYAPSPPFKAGRPQDAGGTLTEEALRIMAPAAGEVMEVIARRFSPGVSH